MKFNNQEVTAVKYTGLATDNKLYTNSRVNKIINQQGIVMWEYEWYITVILKATSGTTKSTKYPNYYFVSGTLQLERGLAHVQLSVPEYATHDWSYNASTGILTYTLYEEYPSTATGSLVYCYRYLKKFDFAPELSITPSYVDDNSFWCELDLYIKNKNSSLMFFTITIKDEKNNLLYSKDLYVDAGKTYGIYTLELEGKGFYIAVSFYAIGCETSSITKYYYPYT